MKTKVAIYLSLIALLRGRYSATAFHRVSDSAGFINGHYVRARRVDLRLSKLF